MSHVNSRMGCSVMLIPQIGSLTCVTDMIITAPVIHGAGAPCKKQTVMTYFDRACSEFMCG